MSNVFSLDGAQSTAVAVGTAAEVMWKKLAAATRVDQRRFYGLRQRQQPAS